VFWVISVYFNIRNTLPKYGRFLLGHPVYRQLGIIIAIWDVRINILNTGHAYGSITNIINIKKKRGRERKRLKQITKISHT
jgi:hypothetical protein